MSRKNKSASGFSGFVKSKTQGTSNEISFSVLDAKVDNSGQGAPPKQAWEFSSSEVEQKKRRRKHSKRVIVSGIVIAVIAVAIMAGTAVYATFKYQQDYRAQLDNVINDAISASNRLAPFESDIQAAIDQPMEKLLADDVAKSLISDSGDLEKLKEILADQKTRIETIQERLRLPEDTERASQALIFISAKLNLIDIGQQISADALPSIQAYSDSLECMNSIMEADSLAREAASLVVNPTKESVQESINVSNSCVSKFNDAQSYLSACTTITDADGTVLADMKEDMQPYFDYLGYRIDAQTLAIDSDNAYLSRNKELVQSSTDKYNQLESDAVGIIASQERYPSDFVQQAYTKLIADLAESWKAESSRAQTALEAVGNG